MENLTLIAEPDKQNSILIRIPDILLAPSVDFEKSNLWVFETDTATADGEAFDVLKQILLLDGVETLKTEIEINPENHFMESKLYINKGGLFTWREILPGVEKILRQKISWDLVLDAAENLQIDIPASKENYVVAVIDRKIIAVHRMRITNKFYAITKEGGISPEFPPEFPEVLKDSVKKLIRCDIIKRVVLAPYSLIIELYKCFDFDTEAIKAVLGGL